MSEIVIAALGIIAAALAGSRHLERYGPREYTNYRGRPCKYDYPIYSPLRLYPEPQYRPINGNAEQDCVLPLFIIVASFLTLCRMR